ncbi:MAG: serine hydrolase [Pseudomonadota bacterium]
MLLLGIGLLLIVLVLTMTLRPYALSSVLEGYPAPQWPSGGEFATHAAPEPVLNRAQNVRKPASGLSDLLNSSGTSILLALKHDKVVLEHYAEGYSAESLLNSYSMVKSLVGALVLKAVDDGKIASLDATLATILPNVASLPVGSVTLRSVLDMTSGIQFEKPAGVAGDLTRDQKAEALTFNPWSALSKLHIQGIRSILPEMRVVASDSGAFSYQNANTALLGLVLEEVYERPLSDLLNEKIWRPAGAGTFHWRLYPGQADLTAYCCLYATPLSWATVGAFLMANGGDRPFLSKPMHDYLMGVDVDTKSRRSGVYRSQWRYDVLDRQGEVFQGPFAYMLGQRGQITYLFEAENMIVVRFGALKQLLHSTLYEIEHSLR